MKTVATRHKILKAAEEVFVNSGILTSSMDDVANRAGLTRRTLYRYFPTKEELVYEVMIEQLHRWNQVQTECHSLLSGRGADKLNTFLHNLVDAMSGNTEVMKFMGEFDFYFQDKTGYSPQDAVADRFFEETAHSDQLVLKLLIEGKEDRSLTYNEDPKLIEATISNTLWSFGQRIAIRMDLINEEFGVDPIKMIHTQIDLYIRALEVQQQ